MQRRTFVKSLSAVLATSILAPLQSIRAAGRKNPMPKPFEVKDSDTLLVQSGIFGQDPFVIGVLRCSNPAAVNRRIQLARKRSKYRCTLTSRSRNKYKVAYFDALLQDWLQHDDVKVELRVIRPPANPENRLTGPAWMRAYIDEVSEALAMGGASAAHEGRILTQSRFKEKQQGAFEKKLLSRNGHIKSIEKVSAKDCELMQFLMTLTGVARASEDVAEYGGTYGRTKTQTISLLRQRLQAPSFNQPQRNRRFELTII